MTEAGALAAIGLDFPPVVDLGAVAVPLRAVGLAAAVALALAWFVRRLRATRPGAPTGDIAFVVLAAIPGAVVGGRVLHGLAYAGAYALDPPALFDLGRGSLSLAGAVLGGALTAAWLCGRLGCRPRAWADAAAPPLLLAVGLGKVAMLLGGSGQGMPWDGRGGIALLGEGPWAAPDPSVPAYPTQLLEGAWALLGIPVVLFLERRARRAGTRPGQGAIALAAVAWWLLGRAFIAAWWRDAPMLGPWGAEGIVAFVGLVGCLVLLATSRRAPRSPSTDRGSTATFRPPGASDDSWMT